MTLHYIPNVMFILQGDKGWPGLPGPQGLPGPEVIYLSLYYFDIN